MRLSLKTSTASSSKLLRQLIREMVNQPFNDDLIMHEGEFLMPLIDHMEFANKGQRVVILLSPEQRRVSQEDELSVQYAKLHGMKGTIREQSSPNYFKVEIPGQTFVGKPWAVVALADLFVLLENVPPDWRPDETLPEDFYAL